MIVLSSTLLNFVELTIGSLRCAWATRRRRWWSDEVWALKGTIASGRLTLDRIDDSVRRILTLKTRYGLLPLLPVTTNGRPALASAPAPLALADVPRRPA